VNKLIIIFLRKLYLAK